jgi:hypothetical protein
MGFIDKVRDSIKSGADLAATKAQAEYEKLQTRRELSVAYESLGVKAFELADRGEISHAELAPLAEQVRAAKEKLESVGKETPAPPASPPEPEPEPEPAAEDSPPPM